NLVCPGVIDTPMHQRLRGELGDELYDSYLAQSVPQGRAGRPEEIADAILYLCSEQASYVTGATLTVDGGLLRTM
ncbi:MAG: SDR family oxidoreductase, partial [Gemmatimonadota bacterium]|nr:SDR family oxidoreductase [Gemmatimonadota bacterium]